MVVSITFSWFEFTHRVVFYMIGVRARSEGLSSTSNRLVGVLRGEPQISDTVHGRDFGP